MTHPDNDDRAASHRKQRKRSRRGPRHLAMEPLEDRRLRAVFMVSNLNDAPVASAGAAPGTLRQAIFDANQAGGDDEIKFAAALTSGGPASINLTSAGQLTINSNVTITGPGADLLSVRAYDPTPGMRDGMGSRVLDIEASAEGSLVTIQGLTLTGGDVMGNGGGIRSDGVLTLVACKVTDNSAVGTGSKSGGGIAISATGSAVVTDSTISGNHALGDYAYGGGISAQGYLSLVRSMITGNKADGESYAYGGGVAAAAQAVVVDSQITMNDAAVDGLTTSGPSHGGGIESHSSLIVAGSQISGNHAAHAGGGVFAKVVATISNSTISGNSADLGGGVYGFELGSGNTIAIVNSIVAGNTGSGVRNLGDLSIAGSSIEGNTRDGVTSNGNLTIANSSIKNNLVGVTLTTGIDQSAAILESDISNNLGGGGVDHINNGGALDLLQVTNSTISGNSGPGWGGISSTHGLVLDGSTVSNNTGTGVAASGSASIVNSTISGNTGTSGGGVSVGTGAQVKVFHSTVTANKVSATGGGVFVAPNGSVELDHTIVAGNTLVSSARQDISGLVFARFSLIGDDTGGVGLVDQGNNLIGHPATPINPLLGPLAFGGGPTMTQVPLVGSPVIDAGDPAALAGSGGVPAVDQRGAPFTRVADGKLPAGARIDIGAVEWQAHAVPELIGDANRDGSVDAADYTIWRNSVSAVVEPYSGADFNGSGTIDASDYPFWKTHFGETLESPASAAGGGAISAEPLAAMSLEPEQPAAAPLGLIGLGDSSLLDRKVQAAAPGLTRTSTVTLAATNDSLLAWLVSQGESQPGGQAGTAASSVNSRDSNPTERHATQAVDAVFDALGEPNLGT